jgi:hypothetical protein
MKNGMALFSVVARFDGGIIESNNSLTTAVPPHINSLVSLVKLVLPGDG